MTQRWRYHRLQRVPSAARVTPVSPSPPPRPQAGAAGSPHPAAASSQGQGAVTPSVSPSSQVPQLPRGALSTQRTPVQGDRDGDVTRGMGVGVIKRRFPLRQQRLPEFSSGLKSREGKTEIFKKVFHKKNKPLFTKNGFRNQGNASFHLFFFFSSH